MPPSTNTPENPVVPSAPVPTPAPTAQPPVESPLKQIRTFQGDVASALSRQKESLYSIQQTEKLKRSSGGSIIEAPDENAGKRKQFLWLTLGSFFFIIIGLVGAWYAYNEFLRKTAPPVVLVPDNRFLSSQSSEEIDMTGVTRDKLFSTIAEKSTDLGSDELRHFVLRRGVGLAAPLMTSADFFQLLASVAPGNLVRALDPLFMLGTLGESRFIIFKLSSFENAFPGMLSWEPNMAAEIGPLFATSESLKAIAPASVFKDVTSRNKDVRVLYAPISPGSSTTTPALLYSFFNNRMLIIADNLGTLKTLMDRLTQEDLAR